MVNRRVVRMLVMVAVMMVPTELPLIAQSIPDTSATARFHLLESVIDEEHADDEDVGLSMIDFPISLNQATRFELEAIPGIDARALDLVLAWRDSLGSFSSLAFLDTVTIISATDIALLRAFTTLRPSATVGASRVRGYWSSRFSRRIELSRGYHGGPDERAYLGSPERHVHRARLQSRRIDVAMTLDKPSGSPWVWTPADRRYGFSAIRGHLSYRPGEGLAIVAGDFRVEYGQGLTMWSGSVFGKGRETVRAVERPRRSIRGSASTMDERMLRGLAVSATLASIVRIDAFASHRYLDAVIDTVDHDDPSAIIARRTSAAVHRTTLELARRKTLSETVVGGAALISTAGLELGAAGYTATFGYPIAPGDRPDTMLDPGGRFVSAAGLFGRWRYRSVSVFGEASAVHGAQSVSATAGFSLRQNSGSEAVIAVRGLSPVAASPFAAGFAHRPSVMRNERGIYAGVTVPALSTAEVRAYVDVIRFPWVRYLEPRPSAGTDAFVEWRHRPRPWTTYYLSWRKRAIDERSMIAGADVPGMDRRPRQSVRAHFMLAPAPDVTLAGRLEASRRHSVSGLPETGFLMFHEIRVRSSARVDVTARLTHFDIESFENRIYSYERDVTGAFSSHMFTGRGRRAWMMLSIDAKRMMRFEGRLSRTWFDDVEQIGSGHDLIVGNTATDIRLQIVVRH